MGALAAGAHRAFIPEEDNSLEDITVCSDLLSILFAGVVVVMCIESHFSIVEYDYK